ncbi:MAG: shikimate kinase [Candidatus Omnitrophica bacterium]|nr:shikimate kinase [Candidatus Omnitrophota bacterium]
MKIILVGFMGSGKSAVGRELAKRLGVRFVDIDELIVKREGRSIAKVFAEAGEPYFRKIEKQITLEVCQRQDPCVIATGGGTLMDPDSRAALKRAGTLLVWLKVSPQKALERTKDHPVRPLLKEADPLNKIASLLAVREPVYAQADLAVDTDHQSVEQVIQEILAFIEKNKKS